MVALDSVTDHVQKLQELRNELSMIDTDIKDKEFITVLFNSLPDVYQNFVTSFCVPSRNQVPMFEEAVRLLQGEQ